MAAPKKPAAPKPPVEQRPDEVKKDDENTPSPASVEMVKALRVQAKRNGFRRAGRAWKKEAVTVPLSELTQDEIEQIRNEAMLTVVEVEIPAESAAE